MFGFFLTESETLGLVYVVDITVKTYKVDFKKFRQTGNSVRDATIGSTGRVSF